MSIKEEVLDMKKEVKKLRQETLASELLKDEKKQKKAFFKLWIIFLIAFLISLCFNIYLLSDIGTTTDIIDIDGVTGINNSQIKIGDDLWEK